MKFRQLREMPHPCGYFDDREALFEHYLVTESDAAEREFLLASGYRAFGRYLFRPRCEGCHRCVPIRVAVQDFEANKTLRRVIKKCQEISCTVGEPVYSEEKYEIYLDHSERFPQGEMSPSKENFVFSFYDNAVPTLEFCFYEGERLVAVGIVHETPQALSSVYFTYRQSHSHLSLGTYSILQEIEHAKQLGKRYHYLGYWIRDNHFMCYKASFYPNEVLLDAKGWRPFRDRKGTFLVGDDVGFERFPVVSEGM